MGYAMRRVGCGFCWAVVSAVVLTVIPVSVHAAPHTWNLSGVTFSDGSTATGSFTYDNVAGTASNWSLTVTVGPGFSAITYTPANSQFAQLAGPDPQPALAFATPAFGVGTRTLRLTPLSTLDGTIGTVGINLATAFGGSGALECFNCAPFRLITAGSFVLAAAVPAFDNGALLVLGALLTLAGIWSLRGQPRRRLAGHALPIIPGEPAALFKRTFDKVRRRWYRR